MFRDLVIRNRTCRGFDESRRISREELLEWVDLTRFTASSANLQPLKYAVVWEEDRVEELLEYTKWAGALPELHLPREGEHPTAFIVVCHDLNIAANPTPFLKDVGIVAQTIALAAREKGISSCMIGSFNPPSVKKMLNLPEKVEPQLVIALGRSVETAVITDPLPDGKTTYYRDENDVHYVPKRRLEDIVL